MRAIHVAILACAVSLVGCGWLKKRKERAEYEKAGQALAPTYGKVADIRDRTLMSKRELDSVEGNVGQALAAVHEEAERCAKAAKDLEAIAVEASYEDVLLNSYVATIRDDLRFASLKLKCEDLSMETLIACSESCNEMFTALEDESKTLQRTAKDVYGLDIPAVAPRH